MASPWLVLIPSAGLVALLAAGSFVLVRARGRDGGPAAGALVRALGYASVLAGAALCCACGLYEGGALALVALTASALAGGTLALLRGRVAFALERRLQAWRPAGRRACVAALLAAVTLAAACALELPWNDEFLGPDTPFQLFGLCLLGMAMASLLLLSRRRGAGMAALVVACAAVGVAQYLIMSFKDVAILPADLFALGTALSVSGGYTYTVGSGVACGIAAACLGVACTSLLAAVAPAHAATSRRSADVAVGVALAAALVALVTLPDYIDDLGLDLQYFSSYSLVSYRRNGFLASFVAAVQDIGIKAPEGYDAAAAERDLDRLAAVYEAGEDDARREACAQFDDERPSIVVVMNETFADLSDFTVLQDAGYAGPTRFKAVDDALLRGDLAVSVLGGGTCNTEFEFLTGNSYAFIGKGKYPYSMYSLAPFGSLARQLAGLGYTCSALHPNEASNWNRDRVYADMGFDRFYSLDDFADAPVLHSGVSDEATYDKVLELLEDADAPQFVFDVTMQNHSGYDQHNLPADLVSHYGLERYADDAWTSGAIDEYLACIEASDRALERLMERLSALDRPVVLVFFGDHQPHFAAWINDDLYAGDDESAHQLRVMHTCYLVWANYDVAGRRQAGDAETTSPDTLAAMTLELVGAPLTREQRARLAARADVPAVSICGYEGGDGRWYAPDAEGPYRDTYELLRRIGYLEFGSRV